MTLAYENTARGASGRRKTASLRVYETLRDDIAGGRYGVGDRLTEESLAEAFEVSRTPVREALRRLASEGFVILSPHAGALVKGWSAQDARDVFETRAIIESEAAARAARNATPRDVEELDALARRMEQAAGTPLRDVTGYSEMNRDFHARILRLSGNQRLEDIALNLMDLGFLVRSYRLFEQEDVERSLSDHRQLVKAIGAGEAAWAGAVMRAHVLATTRIFKGTHDAPDPKAPGTRGKGGRGAPHDVSQKEND
ncbi:MAG: GntR family transcriptional regulator [Vannielia sp.]|uniref:GntR family transcriptional regulator n=1 Tax=Vannielia sp. TaxID=2813045 RepID=UPI003B8BC70D